VLLSGMRRVESVLKAAKLGDILWLDDARTGSGCEQQTTALIIIIVCGVDLPAVAGCDPFAGEMKWMKLFWPDGGKATRRGAAGKVPVFGLLKRAASYAWSSPMPGDDVAAILKNDCAIHCL